jgi:hypothetical protein
MTMVGKKRSHKNTRRLTAKERALKVVQELDLDNDGVAEKAIKRAIQAAVREALTRDDRRDK